jgi:hypothetical protein
MSADPNRRLALKSPERGADQSGLPRDLANPHLPANSDFVNPHPSSLIPHPSSLIPHPSSLSPSAPCRWEPSTILDDNGRTVQGPHPGLAPYRPEDAIGQHAIRRRARERQQRPAVYAASESAADQGHRTTRPDAVKAYTMTVDLPTNQAATGAAAAGWLTTLCDKRPSRRPEPRSRSPNEAADAAEDGCRPPAHP